MGQNENCFDRAPQLCMFKTVLVVEDEPSIRDLIGTVLEAVGYLVLKASNADEALMLAANHLGKIEIVLSDVIMPGINGVELVRQLREQHPSICAIFMSGYSQLKDLQRLITAGAASYLAKPFGKAELLQHISELALHVPVVGEQTSLLKM